MDGHLDAVSQASFPFIYMHQSRQQPSQEQGTFLCPSRAQCVWNHTTILPPLSTSCVTVDNNGALVPHCPYVLKGDNDTTFGHSDAKCEYSYKSYLNG
jgi:hypothetical protein